MIQVKGYAAQSATSVLAPFSFQRREVGPTDILIDIEYCGICHSDIHQARNEWGGSLFPMVPGHEIVGKVKQIGNKVRQFKVGDKAIKTKGYKFPCTIVSVFQTIAGNVRVVAEMDDYGLLHIFNEDQLEKLG